MQIISLFAFTLVSISLLTQSYHYAGAIGIDSSSHGLLYRGRVVRRYGTSGGIYRSLQERTFPKVVAGPTPQKEVESPVPKKVVAGPAKGTPKATRLVKNKTPSVVNAPLKTPGEDIKGPGPGTTPAPPAPAAPTTSPAQTPAKQKGKGKIQPGQDDTTDTTVPNTQQDPQSSVDQGDQNGSAGTPTVATGGISPQAIGGLASVGGVFVLVGGLFAFSQRRKNKEITKSIVSNSSKAWEQQNSAYETLEEEPKPLGSYAVIATYTPTLGDELDIQPGDKVTILVEYDDGWVQGINETRGGVKGVFPRHCVDMNNVTNKPKNINRSSSMGGFTPERYTEVDLS